jgi:ribokinase
MRVLVVGHIEWIDFLRVDHVPAPGEIVHTLEGWEEPGGGGAVAAVQLSKLAGSATFLTALGNDALGRRAFIGLEKLGLSLRAVSKPTPQRRAITHIDANGERTITVVGARLSPRFRDPLPWDDLAGADAVFVTAGDAEILRAARRARVLVATSRILPLLKEAAVPLDALVGSAEDPSERYADGDLDPAPKLVVRTCGGSGGTYQLSGEAPVRYPPAELPGPLVDTYGCGDSFAAGLTWALASGEPAAEAVAFAARCGAAVLTGRGPYPGQLLGSALKRMESAT